jgi:cytochrome c oxidase subunit 3
MEAATTMHGGVSAEDNHRMAKFGMKIFLASEAMLFAGLIAGYIVLRLGVDEWPPADAPTFGVSFPLTAFHFLMITNTILLIASSFTYHWAEAALHKGESGLGWLLATVALGTIFLCVQGYEWWHLAHSGLWMGSHGVYSSSFFVLTGFHGLHVFIGLLMIIWVLFKALGATVRLKGKSSGPVEMTFPEMTGLYWHFVDVVWIFLFFILYIV